MILGATRGAGGKGLTTHLLSRKAGQVVRVLDPRGIGADDFAGGLRELVAGSAHGRTDRPVHHVHVDPPRGAETEALFARLEELYEAEFGLSDAPRLAVEHVKGDRTHRHYVYSLVGDDGRVADLSWERARREKISRIIEVEFGLPMVKGAHTKAVMKALLAEDRLDVVRAMTLAGHLQGPRPVAVTPEQRHQAERTGVDLRQVQMAALAAWRASDNGVALETALAAADLRLAQGDKGPVIVDRAGGAHSLARVLGAASRAGGDRIHAAAVKARVGGLHLPALQEVQHALGDARRTETAPEGESRRGDPQGGPGSAFHVATAPAAPGPASGGIGGGRAAGGDQGDARIDPPQPEALDAGRGGPRPEVRRPRRAAEAVAAAGLARVGRDPKLTSLAAELRAAARPRRPQRAAEAIAVSGLARVAADPSLKARAAELRDAARPAIDRMRAELDRRRVAAEAIIAAARRPPPVAPEITEAKARLKRAKAASSRAFYATSKSEDAARLMLRQERPRGFLSWITGRTAAWQRDFAAAEQELARILALRQAKRDVADQAAQDLKVAERTAPKPVPIDTAPAQHELDLIAAAEDCLQDDPSLARRGEKALLEAAEERLRRLEEERIRMELAARRRAAPRPSREEPAGPRFR